MKTRKSFLNEEVRQRHTAQRELLLDLIREADGHMDATQLYERGREKQPRLSLSTTLI